MNGDPRFEPGQRWRYRSSIAEFENTLVIAGVAEADEEIGLDERTYTVYVRYSHEAKMALPLDYDGIVLLLTDQGLDDSVTELVEEHVKLPWWWSYGRRFKSKKDVPNHRSATECDRVGDVLSLEFQSAKQAVERISGIGMAIEKHRKKLDTRQSHPKPSQSVAESWDRIKAWYSENAKSIGGDLAKGASATAIRRFEKEIGASLPEDFRESVMIHNGGGWWVPSRYGDLLSLDQILTNWRKYSDWLARGTYATSDGSWEANAIEGPIKPIFWNKKRVYVTDNSGNHLTLDLDPPADGRYGQIIHHSHEVGPTKVVASSWGEFLSKLVEELESGKYVYLPDEGCIELVEEIERESW